MRFHDRLLVLIFAHLSFFYSRDKVVKFSPSSSIVSILLAVLYLSPFLSGLVDISYFILRILSRILVFILFDEFIYAESLDSLEFLFCQCVITRNSLIPNSDSCVLLISIKHVANLSEVDKNVLKEDSEVFVHEYIVLLSSLLLCVIDDFLNILNTFLHILVIDIDMKSISHLALSGIELASSYNVLFIESTLSYAVNLT